MRSTLVLAAVLLAASPAPATAQNAPAPGGAPPRAMQRTAPDPAFALMMAYRAIGRAETAGASGRFVDAARSHYRAAIDRYGRNDATGAGAEARLASDLARAATDERPRTAPAGPRDVPAPPSPRPRADVANAPMPGGAPDGMPMRGHMMPGMMRPRGMMRGGFGRHEFSATHLAEALKIDNGAEARQLAQAAVDANVAAQRAALSGNVQDAGRASRVAGDLMAAVDDLVRLNHPATVPRVMRRPLADAPGGAPPPEDERP